MSKCHKRKEGIMAREIVDIKIIAERLHYSEKYLTNKWPELLFGIKPIKLGANRSIRFFWDDIEKILMKEK